METLLQDLKYSVRLLLKSPGFAAIAIATLALGIGANTAIFSVVNSVLLRPLPFAHPSRLVAIFEQLPGFTSTMPMNAPDFRAFSERQRSFDILGIYSNKRFDLTGDAEAERIEGARASATVFTLLGVQPVLGRTFTQQEDQPGHAVAVLSYGLWQRRYGSDRGILGKSISLNREPYTVIGVMPKSFVFPQRGEQWANEPAEIWVPMAFTADELTEWGNMYNHSVLGRLKPGVTLAQAQSDATATIAEVEKLYPAELMAFFKGAHVGAVLKPYSQAVTGEVRAPLLLLLVAVGIVLLIACANVANLLLARATGRQKEVAIRAALGANRWRLARQMLSESILLGVISGVAALLIASWGVGALISLSPADLPRMEEIQMDGRVLLFALGLSLLTAALFGVIPAFDASHADPHDALKEGGRSGGGSRGRRRVQNALIVSQTALAVMLLIGAGLLVRSFERLLQTDPGFRPEHVLTATVPLELRAYPHAAAIRAFYEELLRRAGALPGVSAAGLSTDLPMNAEEHDAVTIEGQDTARNNLPNVSQSWIVGDYFGAMGITLKRGRMFTPEERLGKPAVVIVSEKAARTYWLNGDPMGKRMKVNGNWLTVIGIASDVKDSAMQNPASPHTYTWYLQEEDKYLESPVFDELRTLHLAVRTQGDAGALASAVRGLVASMDSQIALGEVKTMDAAVHESLAPQRFNLLLIGIFAALAVFLAAVGVYCVLSYSVTQRTQEIGVRMALGARPGGVLAMTVREGMKLTIAGTVVGLLAALALTRLMASLLYGVSPHDPLTFVGVVVVMAAISLAACYVPARRATQVDPIVALRYE